ncbi:ABC transporter permease [Leucobacter sp. wl10]|uniref:ABC transporter permease n=1 Tax=Leucobacter sp. wl10 TaxID=2304677 RepID=UPI000E5A3697|nr:ABC transporter permease [Leucobacter sp. wl10]RGE23148.1 ABC transporter permease [Leucobacter sp. wl10]
MTRFILKRLAQLVPVLLGVTLAVFLLRQIIPGDAVDVLLGGMASEDDRAALRDELGLNQNIFVQYLTYLWGLLRGDLGRSSTYNAPVLGVLVERLGNTAIIAVPAVVLASVVGVVAGVWASRKPNSFRDRSVTVSVLLLTSMPSFWLGMLLIMLFSLTLGWFPVSGMQSLIGGGGFADVLQHAILPILTLAAWSLAVITRMTRTSMLGVMSSDYVRSAVARGLAPRQVVYGHALPNALPAVITVIGLQAGFQLSGAVLTETVFSWPGIGFAMASAITNRDMALLQGGILFIAVIFVFINFFVDVLYAVLNPKVKVDA